MLFRSEMPVMSRKHRQNLLRSECGAWLNDAVAEQLRDIDALAPAVISKAAAVVNLIHDAPSHMSATEKVSPAQTYLNLVHSTLKAQGHSVSSGLSSTPIGEFNPAYVHAPVGMNDLLAGLAEARQGRLCFFGPPGTGKTAAAGWLAEQLNRPLVVKRASDLLGAYVGETEGQVAQAFEQARSEERRVG